MHNQILKFGVQNAEKEEREKENERTRERVRKRNSAMNERNLCLRLNQRLAGLLLAACAPVIQQIDDGEEKRKGDGDAENRVEWDFGAGTDGGEPILFQDKAQNARKDDEHGERDEHERLRMTRGSHTPQNHTANQQEENSKVLRSVTNERSRMNVGNSNRRQTYSYHGEEGIQ